MTQPALDQLLTTLDVNLHAFAVCEIAKGSRLKFDAMNVIVVHYVLAGEGTLEVRGQAPIRFGAGSILLVPANVDQSLVAGSNATRDVLAGEHCALLDDGLLQFDASEGGRSDLRVICSTITANYNGSFGLFDFLTSPITDDLTDAPAIRAAFELLITERAAPDFGTHALTEALMKQCLILLVRRHLKRGDGATQLFSVFKNPKLSAAVRDVLIRPAAPHGLSDLAQIAGMSRSAFAKAFADTFEQTPMDFVLHTRLPNAARLLRISDLPIKTIAASTGFASRSHFSRAFKAAYNVDPTAYRKTGRDTPGDFTIHETSWLNRLIAPLTGETDDISA